MVENIFEELDAPGEWFYQAESSTLYYYPMPDEDAETAVFETPILKHLIEFRGSEQQPVTHITIQGIELTQTLRTFMDKYEPLLRSDWMVYRGGAVVFEGTEDCSLKDCYLHNLGGNAVFFSCYNRRSTVSGSHLPVSEPVLFALWATRMLSALQASNIMSLYRPGNWIVRPVL